MEKGSGVPPDAPPSYEASAGHAVQPPYAAPGPAGGFAPPMMDHKGVPPQPTAGVPYPQQGPPPAGVYIPASGQVPPGTQQVVVVVNPPRFGPDPVEITCPHCQSQVRTTTDSEPGMLAWIIAGVLCVVGLWPCACIPCCIDSLNTVTHKCPNCKSFLGRYKGGI